MRSCRSEVATAWKAPPTTAGTRTSAIPVLAGQRHFLCFGARPTVTPHESPRSVVDVEFCVREKRPATASGVTVTSTSKPLIGPAAKGKALDIEATFSLEDADRFGLKVRTGADGEETVIGYDTTTQELYVDRTRSGAVDFHNAFSTGVQTAPLKPKNGKVKLRVLVDWSSVEVFGGSGEAVITDQIFPDPASQGVQVFAENGSVKLDQARVWHLDSYRD
jgi:sucrose-6-phosphate hydrolase SacC (GH32 family)